MYDLAVFIGRFQPFHGGHIHVIEEALKVSKKVLVLVGSAYSPRDIRNFLTFEERKQIIEEEYKHTHRVQVLPLRDHLYNDDRWVSQVQKQVLKVASPSDNIAIIGHSKDESSYYLSIFPQFKQLEVKNYKNLNATDIRHYLLEGYIPEAVLPSVMSQIIGSDDKPKPWFTDLQKEYAIIKEYKESWRHSPYPPIFVTTDAVVTQSGYILLVRRKHAPGIGLWALPGGFLTQSEKLLDGCIRELREETRLKVPEPVLRGSIKGYHTFDSPHRSTRGRTITHAWHFGLKSELELPKVKASAESWEAKWFSYKEVQDMSEWMFEDHWHIIDYFINFVV